MPRFHNEQSRVFEVLEDGDYKLTVFEFSTALSSGEATKNAECYNVVFAVEGSDVKLREQLIDHPKTLWKVNLFLKACGIILEEDEDYHSEKGTAENLGFAWVNPMGLRCHATIGKRKYTSKKSGREVEVNDIVSYLTDRGMLKTDPVLRNKETSTPKNQPPPLANRSPFANPDGTPF